MAHDVYDDMFAIIVRPNKNMKHLNEEFVVKDLCKGKFPIFVIFSCHFRSRNNNFWSKMVISGQQRAISGQIGVI